MTTPGPHRAEAEPGDRWGGPAATEGPGAPSRETDSGQRRLYEAETQGQTSGCRGRLVHGSNNTCFFLRASHGGLPSVSAQPSHGEPQRAWGLTSQRGLSVLLLDPGSGWDWQRARQREGQTENRDPLPSMHYCIRSPPISLCSTSSLFCF